MLNVTEMSGCKTARPEAIGLVKTSKRALPGNNTNTASDGGSERALGMSTTIRRAPARNNPAEGSGETAAESKKPSLASQSLEAPRKGRIGHLRSETQQSFADPTNPEAIDEAVFAEDTLRDQAVIRGHARNDIQSAGVLDDRRFTDPLIAEIVETWRQRQDMVRAQSKLTLQIKAICRRFTEGDKKAADKLYAAIEGGEAHPAAVACTALFMARLPLEEARKGYEKHLTKLGKRLPIAHMADSIRGIGHLALAKIVGECGDLSAYKSVSAVWKRAGLAVIDGERQRKVSGDAALLHGYSPQRRSTLWNIADPMLKAQGKDDAAGPYRRLYDAHKAAQLEKGLPLIHAHNRAMRYMTKALLKDLTLEWRRVSRDPAAMPVQGGQLAGDTPTTSAPLQLTTEGGADA